MMRIVFVLFLSGAITVPAISQSGDQPDSALVAKLKEEGTEGSRVMDVLFNLTDVNGPRLTGSVGYDRAAGYVRTTLQSWGLHNVHDDYWDEPFGRGWELKKFHLSMTGPTYTPLIAWPKAWSPGVRGTLRAEAVYLDIQKESDLSKYEGKLKNKIVLISLPEPVRPSFKADAWRHADSVLLALEKEEARPPYSGRRFSPPTEPQRLAWLKWDLCQREGAAAVLEVSPRLENDGTLVVSSATVPYPAEAPYSGRKQAWSSDAPAILPQMVVAAEHYNRLVRQLTSGIRVRLEMELQVEFTPVAKGYNVVGEIPGTDLADEVVLIGAHLDSWHSATGATDNAVGCAVMMEAMRLILSLEEAPRRTIRIALWGGEEQGLIGSRSYVRRKLGVRQDRSYPYDSIQLTEEGKKFSVYFNMDYGAGKYRGIYLQGNEAAVPIFREWLAPFKNDGAATITLRNATGTDHLSFDAIGLPAFQFIQDPLEYATRTHHANMDLYDKVVPEDLRHNAVITAVLAWMAANRDELVPRSSER